MEKELYQAIQDKKDFLDQLRNRVKTAPQFGRRGLITKTPLSFDLTKWCDESLEGEEKDFVDWINSDYNSWFNMTLSEHHISDYLIFNSVSLIDKFIDKANQLKK